MNLSLETLSNVLDNGNSGKEILEILDNVVYDIRDQICEDLGIANCPENDDEISMAMLNL